MRKYLLIVLIVFVFSKKVEFQNQIQKEHLVNCILDSDKLKKDAELIFVDIKKAFDNNNYLEIVNKIVNNNPENKEILLECPNVELDEEEDDDVLLQKGGGGSGGSGRGGGSGEVEEGWIR